MRPNSTSQPSTASCSATRGAIASASDSRPAARLTKVMREVIGLNDTKGSSPASLTGVVEGMCLVNGRLGIGTSSPQTRLDLVGNVHASGNFDMGFQAIPSDYSGLAAGFNYNLLLACPAGTRVVGGGGGMTGVTSGAGGTYTLRCSGPDESNPTANWAIRFSLTGTTARNFRFYWLCARVQ